MKKSNYRVMNLSFLMIIGLLSNSWADEGIKMNYAEVVLQNLSIGGTYNMTKVANLPLKITNNTERDQIFELSVIQPIMGSRLKPGYQPIPDSDWIKLKDKEVEIKSKSFYITDVIISIPDDKKLLGQKYQVNIQSKQKPKGGGMSLTLAIKGRLLFSVAPVKLDVDKVHNTKIDLDFSITPPRVELKDIPLGKKNKVVADKEQWIKLKNTSKKTTTYYLESLNPKDTVIALDSGYEACPDPTFLTFAKEKIKLNKDQEKPMEMYIQIPDLPEHRGKQYEFLGSVRIGKGMSGIRYFRILVSTEKKEEKEK